MMRRFCIGVVSALLLVLGCEDREPAQAQGSCDQTLSVGANVASAVANAPNGSTICLNDGNYGTVNLGSFTKSPRVTVRSVSPLGAILDGMSVSSGESPDGLVVEGISWSDEVSFSGGNDARNITIRTSDFDTHQLYIETQGYNENNILIDGNTFGAFNKTGVGEGRISVRNPNGPGSDPVGVTITNNVFGPGGCSDGVELGTNGVIVGPGNVFTGIVQSGCETHVDSIQGYGDRDSVVIGNYFDGTNTVDLGWYDGGAGHRFENNVLRDAVTSFRGLSNITITHNTFLGSDFRIEGKSGAPSSMTIRDNVFLGVNVVGSLACDGCAIAHNMFDGAGFGTDNITGTPTFVGGASPSTYDGFSLAAGSIGENAATDGLDMGISGDGDPAPEPPVITSSLTASGTAGEPFQYQIVATNNPTSYGGGGSGLIVNSSTGLLSGTLPAQAGTLNVPISATNEDGTDTETLVVTVTTDQEPPGEFTITFHQEVEGTPVMPIGERTFSSTTWAERVDTTIPAPSGVVDGDLLLLAFFVGDPTPPTPTLPAGFQLISGPSTVTSAGFSVVRRLAWKEANGEPSSYVVDHNEAVTEGMLIRVPGGNTTTDPIVTTNSGTGETTIAQSVTTPSDGSCVLFIAHNWQLYGTATPPSGTTPTFTERLDSGTSLVYYADGILATQGSTGNKSHSNLNTNADDSWGVYLVAIGPSGGVVVQEGASFDATTAIASSSQIDVTESADVDSSAILASAGVAALRDSALLGMEADMLPGFALSALGAIGLNLAAVMSPANSVFAVAAMELQATGFLSAKTGNIVLEAIGLDTASLLESDPHQAVISQIVLQVETAVDAIASRVATETASLEAVAGVSAGDQAAIRDALLLGVAASMDAVGSGIGVPSVTKLVAVQLRQTAVAGVSMRQARVTGAAITPGSSVSDASIEP